MPRLFISPLFKSARKQTVVDALKKGAERLGYTALPVSGVPLDATDEDILVLWNRHVKQDSYAKRFEAIGGKILTFENPYVKVGHNKEEAHVSLGLGWHNNKRYAPKKLDNGERWKSFGIEIKPWRDKGTHILIATQAKTLDWPGLGHESYQQPSGWDSKICQIVRSYTPRDIVFRRHPNGFKCDYSPLERTVKRLKVSNGDQPIEKDLQNAWCTVVHTSNSATESLLNGVPVFFTGESLFLQELCYRDLLKIETPRLADNREELFHHLAWAQYSLEELSNGYFFDVMLSQNSR